MENTKNKEELIEELEGILKSNKDNIYCDEYQLAGAAWSIIGALNLITKLSGLLSRWSFIHASRVGIQCLVPGVSRHTSYILFK